MIWTVFLSCETHPIEETQFEAPTDPLPSTRLLRRISLDLTGSLPSLEDYATVQSDPTMIDELTEQYLDTEAFETRVMFWMADIWHTRVDEFDIVTDDFDLDSEEWWYKFNRSVGEEPLRLMAHIAANDYPWSAIVTANYTMANPLLGDIFPIDYPENGSGWKPAQYTDGRPPVGVLATNGLWWRYPTDSFNKNRTRAAAITRLLLCDDYLLRPVIFEASPQILENTDLALQTDPACLTCHASLDPLAASMFGFWWIEQFNPLEATYYHPEREGMGADQLSTTPAWFGQTVTSFAEVGQHIAKDPRFRQCAVKQFTQSLLNRPMDSTDYEMLEILQDRFETNLLQIKPLVALITQTPEYRSASPIDQHADIRTVHLLTPDLLRSSVKALTNYDWLSFEDPYLDYQFRAMAGGADGFQTFSPQLYPSLTTSLVAKRLAQRASTVLISNKLQGDGKGLFEGITIATMPSDPAFQKKLKDLRLLLHGYDADDDWLGSISTLWQEAYLIGGPDLAWETVISAMLQDIDYMGY